MFNYECYLHESEMIYIVSQTFRILDSFIVDWGVVLRSQTFLGINWLYDQLQYTELSSGQIPLNLWEGRMQPGHKISN